MMGSVRNLHIVLFIGVMWVVQTKDLDQLCPYTHKACACKYDEVKCVKLRRIPPLKQGEKVIPVRVVSFTTGRIKSISETSLPKDLKSIYLHGHPLTKISANAFDRSRATLTHLHINQAMFHSLSPVLNNLTKLIDLSIESTDIHDWDTAPLKHIGTSLQFLKLKKVGLPSWPQWISDFHNLSSIEMSGNMLRDIPDDAFISITDLLKKLYLVDTGLTNIPEALSTLLNLTSLDLSENQFRNMTEIEKITGSSFAENMHSLRLRAVGLNSIANFSNLTNLKIINLASNIITDIPAGSLPVNLIELNLLGNNLSSVPQDVANMSSLFHLDLSHNQIAHIEADSFPSQLVYLGLSYNKLTVISSVTFRNLTVLATLNLDYNPILTISSGSFSDLVLLRAVYIIFTKLTEIPLALTELNSDTELYFTNSKPPACECPTPGELVKWFSSLASHVNIEGKCSSGQSVVSYLSGQCVNSTASP